MPKFNTDTNDEERANESALAELQQTEKDPQAETIELPDDDDETPAETQAAPDRAAKRRNRYREQTEARETAERERDEAQARYRALEAAQTVARSQPAAPTTENKPDPLEEKLKDIQAKKSQIQKEWNEVVTMATKAGAAVSDEITQQYRSRFDALTIDQQETVAERVAARRAAANPQVDPNHAAAVAALRQRYADVANHPDGARVAGYASAQWSALQYRLGRAGTQEEMDHVFDDARRIFGLKRSPPPTAAAKARFSGASAGATGAAPSNGKPAGSGEFQMTKATKSMARAAYPNLPEKVAYQKFAQNQLRRAGTEKTS